MAIPLKRLSSRPVVGPFQPPVDRTPEPLKDWCLGGVALNDPSKGLDVQVWELSFQGGDFVVTPESQGSPTVVLSGLTGVTECGLAFDQNMNVFIAFVQDGRAKYYWFDPTILDYRTTEMAEDVVSPRCRLDDLRITQVLSGRIILAYVRDNQLMFRTQEDRYETEYPLTEVESELRRIGMGVNGRFQFEMVNPNAVTPPTNTLPPLVEIPYWTNPEGGRVDLSQTVERTWVEVFGAPFADDAVIDRTVTISDNQGNVPWSIPIFTSDGGNRLRVRFSQGVADDVFIALCAGDGTIQQKLTWSDGSPDTEDIAFPTNEQVFLVMASSSDDAVIRKRDLTPDEPEAPPEPPPGTDPPPDIDGATRWSSFFGVRHPLENNGFDSGFSVDKQIPASGVSLWFEVGGSIPPKGISFRITPLAGPGAEISVSTIVGDYSNARTGPVPSTVYPMVTTDWDLDTYGSFPIGAASGRLERGRKYVVNIRPWSEPNGATVYYRFSWFIQK